MTPEQIAKSGSEDAHQAALFAWAALEVKTIPQLKWLHAIPNGGNRDARSGARMKATGARRGILDVFFPVPTSHNSPTGFYCPGLYIEMKKAGTGRLTTEQKEYSKHLKFYGYAVSVCFTWEEARDAILDYMRYHSTDGYTQYKEYMQ